MDSSTVPLCHQQQYRQNDKWAGNRIKLFSMFKTNKWIIFWNTQAIFTNKPKKMEKGLSKQFTEKEIYMANTHKETSNLSRIK